MATRARGPTLCWPRVKSPVTSAALADAAFNLYVNAVDADGNQITGGVTQKGYANDFSIGAFAIGVSQTGSGLKFTLLNTQGGVGAQSVNLFKAVVLNEPLR